MEVVKSRIEGGTPKKGTTLNGALHCGGADTQEKKYI